MVAIRRLGCLLVSAKTNIGLIQFYSKDVLDIKFNYNIGLTLYKKCRTSVIEF